MPRPTHMHHTTSSGRKLLKRTVRDGPNKSVTKKDGAGRFNAGKLLDYEPVATDPRDPNYDSDEHGDVVLEVRG